jgi:hypothetical protein
LEGGKIVRDAQEKLATIKRGIERAAQEAAQAQAKRQAAENHQRIEAFDKVMIKKVELAGEITATAEKMAFLWEQSTDLDVEAEKKWPALQSPMGAHGLGFGPATMRKLFGQELWRVLTNDDGTIVPASPGLTVGRPRFPGIIPAHADLTGMSGQGGVSPQKMLKPLVERMKACRQAAMDVLEGRRFDFGRVTFKKDPTTEESKP